MGDNNKACKHTQKAKIVRQEKPCAHEKIDRPHEESFAPRVFEAPDFIKKTGPKQLEILATKLPSIMYWSLATVLCTIYICEWKDLMQHVPFYGGKFKKDE